MINIKDQKQIKIMREGGEILKKVMDALKEEVKPGISTEYLDELASQLIKKYDANPSFLNYQGYPKSICTSINNEVVHGIPSSNRILKEGDILSLDIGIFYKGYHTDAALTLPVGNISEENRKLINIAKNSLLSGLKKVKEGNRIGDISYEIQKSVEEKGYSVVKSCTGHGIGRDLHEDPAIPNFGKADYGPYLKEGMTLAIEPMVNEGDFQVQTDDDGWTIRTCDGKNSAHFEFTVLVLRKGYENLTPIS
ncbi:type I methionyl aminopeptidase [bacterium CG_4_10_14_0_2_um_filter_33_32]|nr:MAG: type I methionyl aminopeptidase [bacterium CG2_30_33_46]PIR67379.1 MAG: type I methionyl aminopeptidase [bacterium CG10_big_fil_rev_8_21_14_0_10_33_18]PIU76767.1 MAG: type I methionyl aminopeptidase [bacterium CG06_land_8_20_14_3_00_33_50]PIW81288.1 MAG: type I methionyl aminopeptidase [bacterium CG_4_8_14_3_um_filter_33_28]PIY85723.1 MAG: type I methionyl aminopeptidase [bacterium CG_4_10_14_0_8_um_filter_33_57]PIZ86574.1 MAG: type I methionyl aminopeptidase [bacterium CG_4_10_14_0_2_